MKSYHNMTHGELIREAEHDNNALALALLQTGNDERDELLERMTALLGDARSHIDYQMGELKLVVQEDLLPVDELLRRIGNRLGDLSIPVSLEMERVIQDVLTEHKQDTAQRLEREWLRELVPAAEVLITEQKLTGAGVELENLDWSAQIGRDLELDEGSIFRREV